MWVIGIFEVGVVGEAFLPGQSLTEESLLGELN